MSVTTVIRNATRNQATFDYEAKQIFLGEYTTIQGTYVNKSGALEDVPFGQVLGVVAATGQWTICKSGAADGSEIPRGVILDELSQITIDGTVSDITVCDFGYLKQSSVSLFDTDTWNTRVGGIRMEDLLRANSRGIRFGATKDSSIFDN